MRASASSLQTDFTLSVKQETSHLLRANLGDGTESIRSSHLEEQERGSLRFQLPITVTLSRISPSTNTDIPVSSHDPGRWGPCSPLSSGLFLHLPSDTPDPRDSRSLWKWGLHCHSFHLKPLAFQLPPSNFSLLTPVAPAQPPGHPGPTPLLCQAPPFI